ncbi:Requim, req/dpf2 [Theileria orientalis]|uniref:Requim, req/dpf2 n=1 Tax=Theileria orientalis TaxID=68886 RepID=A0A976M6I8_THEOR|nr:Requim, req/dpf2 [Theileria orientalis]
MTSLRYFRDRKPEYYHYIEEGRNAPESAGSSDTQAKRRVTVVKRHEHPDETLIDDEEPRPKHLRKITELFSDLDDDLLHSIDEYLHNGSIKRSSVMRLDDLEEKLKETEPSLRGKRAKRSFKRENDRIITRSSAENKVNEECSGSNEVGSGINEVCSVNTVSDATGRSWSVKLSKISTRNNSLEKDEVTHITDTTRPKISINTTSIDTSLTGGATAPATVNYEEDLPIKKSRLKIIPDSQRYTSSDSGLVKDEFEFTSAEITAPTGKCSCSNTCDHTSCNCSHHHGFHVGLSEGLFRASGDDSNGTLGANGTTSTLISTIMDAKSKSVVGEDGHINLPTPKNEFAQSTTANRPNVTTPSGVRTNLSGSYDSDSSEEEEDFDECIICSESMKSELKNEIGVLDVCNHIFCFKCIKMWSDRANLCPLCKREFGHIRKVNLYNIQDLIEKYYLLTSATTNAGTSSSAGIGGNGAASGSVEMTGVIGAPGNSVDRLENKYWRERRLRCIRKNKISKLKKIISEKINWFDLIPSLKVKVAKKKLQEEEEEGCAICGNDDNWPQLLLCDSCDKGYHMYCLDPPLTEVPANNWYCSQCNNEAPSTVTGAHDFGTGSSGSSLRSGSTRGRGNRRQNNSNTERTRSSRATRGRTSSGFLRSLLQNQADYFDLSLGGGSGSGIVSRARLENLIRESIITISSTMSSPRTHPLNTMLTTGTRPRRQPAEAQSLEEELRTNLLSQVYMGLNRSMPNAARRATTLRSSIISRANRTRKNSAIERIRKKRERKTSASATRRDRSVETSAIPETIETSRSGRGGRTNRPETANRIDTIDDIVRGRSAKIANSILTSDLNPGRVHNTISTAPRTNATSTPHYSRIANDDPTTESIKATVKGRLKRFNFNTKNVDQLIQESLESIENYLAFNKVPRIDADSFSPTTSTSTSAFNREARSTSTANTPSVPTGASTAARIPSNTKAASNAGVPDVTGSTSVSYPITRTNTTSSAVTSLRTEATMANSNTDVSGSAGNTSGKAFDELTNRGIDMLLSNNASRSSIGSDNTGPNITSSEGTGETQSSDTVPRKEKKYTSFIYRYRTITSDDPVTSTSQSSRQEPYINGKTVKYLF